jgi:ferredoxin
MTGWRVEADLDLCQAHQMCLMDAPEVFGFDRDADRVTLAQPHPADGNRPAVERAVRNCPAMALTIVDPAEED